MIKIDNINMSKSQEESRKYSDEQLDNIIAKCKQEEREWFEMIEKERIESEKDPNIVLRKSQLEKIHEQNASLKEENQSLRMQLNQYENFFRAMYDKMMEAQRKKAEESLKPKMIGNIKLYE